MSGSQVVGAIAGLQLVQEPQAALCERHRILAFGPVAARSKKDKQLRFVLANQGFAFVGQASRRCGDAQPFAIGGQPNAQ